MSRARGRQSPVTATFPFAERLARLAIRIKDGLPKNDVEFPAALRAEPTPVTIEADEEVVAPVCGSLPWRSGNTLEREFELRSSR